MKATPAKRLGSYGVLRILAALMVFHSHSFAIVYLPEPVMPGGLSLGGVAVVIFFALSGYFVTGSGLGRSFTFFCASRALRLWPALFICCVLSVIVGALVTNLNAGTYWGDPNTLSYMRNVLTFFTPMQADLPGVFEGRPITGVNGSLWTLRYEVFFYVLFGIACLYGKLGVRAVALILVAAALAVGFLGHGSLTIRLLDSFELKWIVLLGLAFSIGALFATYGLSALNKTLAVSAFALFISISDPNFSQLSAAAFYSVAAIYAGQFGSLDELVIGDRDYSYGLYIYAFPTQQIAAMYIFGAEDDFFLYYSISLIATFALAAMSWHLIERPALQLKNFLPNILDTMPRKMGRQP